MSGLEEWKVGRLEVHCRVESNERVVSAIEILTATAIEIPGYRRSCVIELPSRIGYHKPLLDQI